MTRDEINLKIKQGYAALESKVYPEELKDRLRKVIKDLENSLSELDKTEKKIDVIIEKQEKVAEKIEEKKDESPAEKQPVIEKKQELKVEKTKVAHKKKEAKISVKKAAQNLSDIISNLPDKVKQFNKGRSKKEIASDKKRVANKPGKHISSTGKTYYESRPDRTDISIKQRLDNGGIIGTGKNTYIAFYKNKEVGVKADTTYQAQLTASEHFKAKKSYDVTVMLAELEGKPYYHSTASFCCGGDISKYYHGGMPGQKEVLKWFYEKLKLSGVDIAEFKHKAAQLKMDLLYGHVGEDDYKGWETTKDELSEIMTNADIPEEIYYDNESGAISETAPDQQEDESEEWHIVDVKNVVLGQVSQYMEHGGELSKVPAKWVKDQFSTDGENFYEGYHIPTERWNGFATPVFDKKTTLKILRDVNKQDKNMAYKAEGDKIFIWDKHNSPDVEDWEEVGPLNITIDGMNMYGPGSYSWIWDEKSADDYAAGGKIENQYSGKTAEQIWTLWDKNQRHHFLADHFGDISFVTEHKSNDWSDLPIEIQLSVETHSQRGQYANGGKIKNDFTLTIVDENEPGEKVVTTLSDFLKENRDGLNASEIRKLKSLIPFESMLIPVHAGFVIVRHFPTGHKTTFDKNILKQLAIEFSKEMHNQLTKKQIEQVNAENKKRNDHTCASDDYCDANMVMDAAFTKVFKRPALLANEVALDKDLNDQEDIDMKYWNTAWTIAKENDFDAEKIKSIVKFSKGGEIKNADEFYFSAKSYLKEAYGLNPEDLNMTDDEHEISNEAFDNDEDPEAFIDYYADKYGLEKLSSYSSGGRTKAAIAKDRKYINSSQAWEVEYKRKKPGKHYLSSGGIITKKIHELTDDVKQKAIQEDDFDVAIAIIQNAIGQPYGDIASVHFSDFEHDSDTDWDDKKNRLKIIEDYLQAELSYDQNLSDDQLKKFMIIRDGDRENAEIIEAVDMEEAEQSVKDRYDESQLKYIHVEEFKSDIPEYFNTGINIDVYGYQTQCFNNAPEAVATFKNAIIFISKNISGEKSELAAEALVNSAKHFDLILITEKECFDKGSYSLKDISSNTINAAAFGMYNSMSGLLLDNSMLIKHVQSIFSLVPDINFSAGGRLKSATMRDRKYVNQSEEWETNYHRKTPSLYYMAAGGKILSQDQYDKLIKKKVFQSGDLWMCETITGYMKPHKTQEDAIKTFERDYGSLAKPLSLTNVDLDGLKRISKDYFDSDNPYNILENAINFPYQVTMSNALLIGKFIEQLQQYCQKRNETNIAQFLEEVKSELLLYFIKNGQ